MHSNKLVILVVALVVDSYFESSSLCEPSFGDRRQSSRREQNFKEKYPKSVVNAVVAILNDYLHVDLL